MALGIRGANPIWSEFDLQGNLFDDSFYMWVLENTIPYIPAPVYHDPELTLEWENPIQFLSNGTLPIDIYFEESKVYRLEFRKNDGLLPPSQSDPLIYEVNNYIAGESGAASSLDSTSSNQITNPQFALINFDMSSSISLTSATNPDPIAIGPGWFLQLTGTGNVTITRVSLNNSNINPSNAPYALRLQLSGWDSGGVILRQRFNQNGMLWANKTISTAITTHLQGASQTISARLVSSNGATLATIMDQKTVNESWRELTGHGTLPATTNPNPPPSAYIDYQLLLPTTVDIYLTSLQVLFQDVDILLEPTFEQDSIDRQIDHTYHSAHPIVPIGMVIDMTGFTVPAHYLQMSGQVLNRFTYRQLMDVWTKKETVTLTTGANTFSVVVDSDYYVGMPIEGAHIPTGTVITALLGGNIIQMSNNASAPGGSTEVSFYMMVSAINSTTFTMPDEADLVPVGHGGTIFGSSHRAVGAMGGALTVTLVADNYPHLHGPLGGAGIITELNSATGNLQITAGGPPTIYQSKATTESNSNNPIVPVSIVQKGRIYRKCVRYE